MKLTTLLIIIAFVQVSAKTYSQVTLKETNAPLEKVIKSIKAQTGYFFVYSDQEIQTKPISVNVKNVTIEQALDACFNNQPVTYRVVDKNIILQPKVTIIPTKAQGNTLSPIDISGKVVDENGQGLPGATVKVVGSKSTITNGKGEFSLSGVDVNANIEITFIGYEKTISGVGSNPILVKLKKSESKLDEIQVIAYGTTTQRLNVGSITKVSSADIEKQPVGNVFEALEGRVPGLVISQTSGLPGSSIKIQIRGQNSLAASPYLPTNFDNPYFVIDGVPFGPQNFNINQVGSMLGTPTTSRGYAGVSPLSILSPSDIESIEVLRDADATAIYGSQGANGVILITTKRGKAGKESLNVNISRDISQVTNSMPMMNTEQYLQMRKEAFANDNIVPSLDPSDPGYAPDLLLFDSHKNTDWRSYFVQNNAYTTNANVSLSGGSTNTQYRISLGTQHDTYIYPGDFSYNKENLSFNLHNTSNDGRFKLQFITNYGYEKNNLSSSSFGVTQAFSLPPNFPNLLNPDGTLLFNYNGVNLGNYSNLANPLAFVKQPYAYENFLVQSALNVGYEIIPGLEFRSNFSFSRTDTRENSAYPKSSQDPDDNPVSTAFFALTNLDQWTIEPQVELKRKICFGSLDVLFGASFLQNLNRNNESRGVDYSNDILLNSLEGAARTSATDGYALHRTEGYFGRINYIINEKFIVDITGRRDGSSRFGPEKLFGNFGALGLGWIFSEEAFMKNNLPFVSYGKLRATYGTTGSDAGTDYQYLSTYQADPENYQGSVPYSPTKLTNSFFSWGLTKKMEIGLDLGLFNDRLLFSLTAYRTRSGNQLVAYNLPAQTGFNSIFQNAPYTVQNQGLELNFSTVNTKTSNLSWTTSFNITFPENKLISFPNIEHSPYAAKYFVGQSVDIQRGYISKGVNQTTGLYQFLTATGQLTYNPVNAKDYFSLGSPDPKFSGGINNAFSYKSFQLSLFIQFVKQMGLNYLNQIYENANFIPVGGPLNLPTTFLSRWQQPGDHKNLEKLTTQYNDAFNSATSYFAFSSGSFTDASFVRIKSLSINYSFKRDFIKKFGLNGLNLSVNAENLFTITNYLGNDPENQNFYTLPPLKTYSVKIQITL